jgi:hypothetical protein
VYRLWRLREVCPVEAIFFEDDLPEQFAAFKARNAAFFS